MMACRCSSGPISPEIMLAISLRMCAGARFQDLRRCFNVSKASIYVVFHKVIAAINRVEVIEFPMSDTAKMAELSGVSTDSQEVSWQDVASLSTGFALELENRSFENVQIPPRISTERDSIPWLYKQAVTPTVVFCLHRYVAQVSLV